MFKFARPDGHWTLHSCIKAGCARDVLLLGMRVSLAPLPTTEVPQPMSTSAPSLKSSSYLIFESGCSYPTNVFSFCASTFGARTVYVCLVERVNVLVSLPISTATPCASFSWSHARSRLAADFTEGLNSGLTHVADLFCTLPASYPRTHWLQSKSDTSGPTHRHWTGLGANDIGGWAKS